MGLLCICHISSWQLKDYFFVFKQMHVSIFRNKKNAYHVYFESCTAGKLEHSQTSITFLQQLKSLFSGLDSQILIRHVGFLVTAETRNRKKESTLNEEIITKWERIRISFYTLMSKQIADSILLTVKLSWSCLSKKILFSWVFTLQKCDFQECMQLHRFRRHIHVFVLAHFRKESKNFKNVSLTGIASTYMVVLFSLYTQFLCRTISLGNQHQNS